MIHMVFDGVPPTVNKAYFEKAVRKGKQLIPVRTLTTKGRAYKREFSTEMVRRYSQQLSFITKNEPYALSIRLYLPELLNKGWPQTTQSRYKKLDASNRIKLLEDAIVDAIGIDDSHFMQVSVEKAYGPKEETHVWIWKTELVQMTYA